MNVFMSFLPAISTRNPIQIQNSNKAGDIMKRHNKLTCIYISTLPGDANIEA